MDTNSINFVLLVGNITNDPELRHGKGENAPPFVWLGVATNEAFVNKKEKKATFTDVMVFGKTAEFVCKYFKKGSGIMVKGKLNKHFFKDEEGVNKSKTQLIADQITFPPRPAREEPDESPEEEPPDSDEPF